MHRAAPAMLLAVLLSGCIGGENGDDGRPPVDAPIAPDVLPWDLLDCSFVVWGVPVASGALEPYLPEGFTLSTSDGPLTPVLGDAYLGFEAFVCASGMGLDGRIQDMTYGSLFTSVEPPPELLIDGVDEYYYKWDPLVPDAARRTYLQEAGMGARAGSAAVDDTLAPLKRAAYTLEEVGTFQLDAAAPPPAPSTGGGRFAEFTPLADGGHAVWSAEYVIERAASGSGAYRVDAGSWAAEVLGKTQGTAPFNHGTWSFQDGNLTLPLQGVAKAAQRAAAAAYNASSPATSSGTLTGPA